MSKNHNHCKILNDKANILVHTGHDSAGSYYYLNFETRNAASARSSHAFIVATQANTPRHCVHHNAKE